MRGFLTLLAERSVTAPAIVPRPQPHFAPMLEAAASSAEPFVETKPSSPVEPKKPASSIAGLPADPTPGIPPQVAASQPRVQHGNRLGSPAMSARSQPRPPARGDPITPSSPAVAVQRLPAGPQDAPSRISAARQPSAGSDVAPTRPHAESTERIVEEVRVVERVAPDSPLVHTVPVPVLTVLPEAPQTLGASVAAIHAQPSRAEPVGPAPAVEITIGRIEITMPAERHSKQPMGSPERRVQQPLGLTDYLAQRERSK